MGQRFISVAETAKMLNIPLRSLRNSLSPGAKKPLAINGQIIKPVRINNRLRIDREVISKILSN